MNKLLCNHCNRPLVTEDENGVLTWGKHEAWCPAAKSDASKPGRKSATSKLICDECIHSHMAIHDLSQLSFCAKCPRKGIVRDAVDAHFNGCGDKKPVEVIYPPLPRRQSAVPLRLYTDLLQRYTALENKYKRGR